MFHRMLVFGLLGLLALGGSWAPEVTGNASAADTTGAKSVPQTKQVTLSVSGMT